MKNAKECILDCFMRRFPFVGHTHGFNAPALSALIDSLNKPDVVVLEVGSWMGASARFFAAHDKVKAVVCVDHWDRNQVENWQPGKHPEDWMDFMYEHFLANCLHAGLAEKIYPLRMRSHDAIPWVKAVDLVYLDGAHQTDMVRQDLEDYYALGTIVCGDDWVFTQEPENVRGAVEAFAASMGRQVGSDGNLWVII